MNPRQPVSHMRSHRPYRLPVLQASTFCLAALAIISGCTSGGRHPSATLPNIMSDPVEPTAEHRPVVGGEPRVGHPRAVAQHNPAQASEHHPVSQVVFEHFSDQTVCNPPGCNQPEAHGGNCYPGGPFPPHGYAAMPAYIPNPQGIDPNEFLCDGGDAPPAARARAGDQIIGVNLEDTVARYTTERGDVHISPSNRVCVYAPRFGAVRRVTGAELGALAISTQRLLLRDGPNRIDAEQPGLAVTGRDELVRSGLIRGPDSMRARDRGVKVENILQPQLAEDVLALLSGLSIVNRGILRESDKAWINIGSEAAIVWSVDQEVVVVVAGQVAATVIRDQAARELVIYELADAGRLRVCKLADRRDALPGEIVTFILRIDNVGESPLHNIVLTDSLTTRLEYVPESQTSTRDADFSVQVNEGESLRLTWKFAGELQVGEGATVEFKCRVR
jgi:uncharacterized repeat protein (TIGR01451 family)